MTTVPRTLRRALAGAALAVLAGCAGLPQNVDRSPSSALEGTGDTRLGRSQAPAVSAHAGRAGVHALSNGREAFAARMLLARVAERSLDAQYYIWHRDTSGGLLAQAMWEAAERGVRVRMLLDDANTQGEEDVIATLDLHPNIEVRLFNPFVNRSWRIGDYMTDFQRLNRRMHNKSFTADNQVAVVGGRNVGDEYLGADSPVAFTDLDVVVNGAVVRDISAEFDAYWNSPSAYPARSIVGTASPETVRKVLADWDRLRASAPAQEYLAAVRSAPLLEQVLAGTVELEWVGARLVNDDPAKVLNPPDRRDLHMQPRLEAALGQPMSALDLVSPYFVPTREGTDALVAIASRGVKIRVLTNSLAATDVTPVYAGYSKYQMDLLRGGIRLFELKRTAAPPRDASAEHHQSAKRQDAALHAKTIAVDRHRIFVGSFNLDPRSARLNTEMGVVLESAVLAGRLSAAFDEAVPAIAYEVKLAPDGQHLEWIEQTAGGEVRYGAPPDTGPMLQFWSSILSVLPIEWLL